MGFDSNGVLFQIPAEQRLNVFALVIYIPDPLGRFLDDMRKELVPGCNPHAHVSDLPPRPQAVDWQVASEQVKECAGNWAPFSEALEFAEPFQYHPHVTLAQEIPPALVEEVDRKAHRLWDAYDGPRTFRAERMAFVQITLGNCWIDLAESDLGAVTV